MMNRKIWAVCLVLLLVAPLVVACSGGGGGGDGGGPTGGGSPSGIGPSGGTVTSSDGKTSVNIPAGALSQDTAITVVPAANPPSGNLGTAYEFGPAGTSFGQPVTISISYDESSLPSGVSEADLRLGKVVNSVWQPIANSVDDTGANLVSGTTSSFSVYGVVAVGDEGAVPAAPTGVTAVPGDGTVTISWNTVPGATEYNFYMASQRGVTKSNYNTLTGGMKHAGVTSPFVHTGLTNGTTYYFAVTSVNTNGESTESAEVTGSPTATTTAGTFSPTGSMGTARLHHKATLLSNGKVLIAGGSVYASGVSSVLSSAELYDPTTGTFSPTGSMSTARVYHTATLLSNGKVLITGGYTSGFSSVLSSAEIYDSTTSTFSPTGSMSTARVHHTATLLSNGKVLIAGGFGGIGRLSSAELYDPTTGTFSQTGSMSTADRDSHTATLLSNGKVLIAGGSTGCCAPSSAELYDPTTGTFSPTGSMSTARLHHVATLLSNGKVLIAGGSDLNGGSGVVLSSAELYNPATGTFSPTGSMSTARVYHAATLLSNGKVLIAGGSNVSGGSTVFLSGAELYDPTTGTFSPTGSMSTARSGHTATLFSNGKVLIAGGSADANTVLASAELFE